MKLPPVYIFSTNERTKDLCVYSYEKVGFTEIVVIEGNTTFREKYLNFVNHAIDTDHEFFVRADADQVVFSGIVDMIKLCDSENPHWIEGKYFDYFMNRRHGGTPHIVPRKAVEILSKDNSCMPESKKPETDFTKYLRDKNLVSFKHSDILTSLHEFEQFPSKVCNSFLNRLKRGHTYLYDFDYINKHIPEYYLKPLIVASQIFETKNFQHADNMSYVDFSFLDEGFEKINEKDMEDVYNSLRLVYESS